MKFIPHTAAHRVSAIGSVQLNFGNHRRDRHDFQRLEYGDVYGALWEFAFRRAQKPWKQLTNYGLRNIDSIQRLTYRALPTVDTGIHSPPRRIVR